MSRLEEATAAWHREVEEEAARLIESGIPPFEATVRARDIVSQRRRHNRSTAPREETRRG